MLTHPVFVTFWTEDGKESVPVKRGQASWKEIQLELDQKDYEIKVNLRAKESPLCYVSIRFEARREKGERILGDEWERSYGNMAWQPLIPHRHLPWYFLLTKDRVTKGAGVKVRPKAMCFWQVDEEGITLFLDVRCGGSGVRLNGRTLEAAVIVWNTYYDMDSFDAARMFCKEMCSDGIFPDEPIYGSNNWYYAYGNSSHEMILKDADYLAKLTNGIFNRPFMVIDDGWQDRHRIDQYNGGPWRKGNEKFPDMKGLAEEIKKKNVKPGIWIRLLLNEDSAIPKEWRLSHNGCLDPSHPKVLRYVEEDIKTLCKWGYQLIKHDFSTYDILGKWGFEMEPFVTSSGWHFYNEEKTTAEIIVDFYQKIYQTAQLYGSLVLGCNTIGHLGAGLMHLNRTGDDTSGFRWDRTRKNGVNALAFRMPQHGIFFDADADCVGIMGKIPWEWNRKWTELLALSGTSLFLSVKPGLPAKEEEKELSDFLEIASRRHEPAKPMDWEETSCPSQWETEYGLKKYNWYQQTGLLFGDLWQ